MNQESADTAREPRELSDEALVGDLVVALLAVNGWSIEKTFKLYEGLEAEHLVDLEAICKMTQPEVSTRLERAGYRRGLFMIDLLASRLHGLALTLAGDGTNELRRAIEAKDGAALEKLLLEVKGVGPRVVANYRALRGV